MNKLTHFVLTKSGRKIDVTSWVAKMKANSSMGFGLLDRTPIGITAKGGYFWFDEEKNPALDKRSVTADQAPLQMNTWRPIKTAPKDKLILLATPPFFPDDIEHEWEVLIGRWVDCRHTNEILRAPRTVNGNPVFIGANDPGWMAFYTGIMDCGDGLKSFEGRMVRMYPTHWMPLPNPPKGKFKHPANHMNHYLKVGDIPQVGDYRRIIGDPNATWYPVWSTEALTENDVRSHLYIRPNPKWRHTDEFEPVTPEWLKQP